MLNYKPVVGALLLSLSLGLAAPVTASAASTPATVATSRPSQADLKAAITKLQSIGNYQKYFTGNMLRITSDVDAHYQEYNYINKVVLTLQLVLPDYDSYSDQELSSLIEAADDAYLATRLKLGIVQKEAAKTNVKPATTTNQTTASSSSTTKPAANPTTTTVSSSKPAASSQTTTTNSLPTTSTGTASSQQVANTTPVEIVIDESAETVSTASEVKNDTVEVPATGEVETPVSFNLLALLAGFVAGAAVLSLLLTLIIRREPQHHKGRRY